MVDPPLMCDQHLLGEHLELHMILGSLTKGYVQSIIGLVNADLLQLEDFESRHEVLAEEMRRRGMNHQSPLRAPEQLWDLPSWGVVDPDKSLAELHRRCAACRARSPETTAREGALR